MLIVIPVVGRAPKLGETHSEPASASVLESVKMSEANLNPKDASSSQSAGSEGERLGSEPNPNSSTSAIALKEAKSALSHQTDTTSQVYTPNPRGSNIRPSGVRGGRGGGGRGSKADRQKALLAQATLNHINSIYRDTSRKTTSNAEKDKDKDKDTPPTNEMTAEAYLNDYFKKREKHMRTLESVFSSDADRETARKAIIALLDFQIQIAAMEAVGNVNTALDTALLFIENYIYGRLHFYEIIFIHFLCD